MRRRLLSAAGAVAIALPLAVAGAGTAFAAEPFAQLTVTPNPAQAGDRVTLNSVCRNGDGTDGRATNVTSNVLESVSSDFRTATVKRGTTSASYNVDLTCSVKDDAGVQKEAKDTASLTVGRGGNNGGSRGSCADYARDGIYDIRRGDFRYRDVLDRDRDGIACERNQDDWDYGDWDRNGRNNGPWDRDRECRDLREARDEARTQINEANTRITEGQALTSADGAAITSSERLEIDQQVREAQDAIKAFEDERNDANRRCDDVDDDLNVALLPIPGDSTVVTSVAPAPAPAAPAPAPSYSGSGGGSRNDAPTGGSETGIPADDEVDTSLVAGLAVGFGLAAAVGSVAIAQVYLEAEAEAEANQR